MNLFSSELNALERDKVEIDEMMNQVKSIDGKKYQDSGFHLGAVILVYGKFRLF